MCLLIFYIYIYMFCDRPLGWGPSDEFKHSISVDLNCFFSASLQNQLS